MAKDPISPGDGSAITGLAVQNNETIQAFLLLAAADEQRLSGELRDLASDLSFQSSIPYRSLRSIWSALPVGARPSITTLFSGAEFPFSSPKPREKSEELKKRLMKLAEMAERKEYEELVKDVAPRKEEAEPFSSYKDQIGFGLHVLVVMFTGYLFGFAAFRALFNHSAVMNAAGGILGMEYRHAWAPFGVVAGLRCGQNEGKCCLGDGDAAHNVPGDFPPFLVSASRQLPKMMFSDETAPNAPLV